MNEIARLHSTFRYEPLTGRLIHRRTGREITGPYRRTDIKADYASARFAGRKMPASRIIWALTYGEWPPDHLVVDHINGDTHDNRVANYRLLPIKENSEGTREIRALISIINQGSPTQ